MFLTPTPNFSLGILKESLLSLTKIEMGDLAKKEFRTTILYKHYILCFKSEDQAADCVIIDTQKKTVAEAITGLNLGVRTGYSICHWKDNIFVIFGGYIEQKPTDDRYKNSMFGAPLTLIRPEYIDFLSVIEEDCNVFVG